jgi:hypothetical protein
MPCIDSVRQSLFYSNNPNQRFNGPECENSFSLFVFGQLLRNVNTLLPCLCLVNFYGMWILLYLVVFVRHGNCSVCCSLAGFAHSWKLAMLLLATIPLLAIGAGGGSRAVRSREANNAKNEAASSVVADEVLMLKRVVLGFSTQLQEFRRFNVEVLKAYGVGGPFVPDHQGAPLLL